MLCSVSPRTPCPSLTTVLVLAPHPPTAAHLTSSRVLHSWLMKHSILFFDQEILLLMSVPSHLVRWHCFGETMTTHHERTCIWRPGWPGKGRRGTVWGNQKSVRNAEDGSSRPRPHVPRILQAVSGCGAHRKNRWELWWRLISYLKEKSF